MPASQDCFRHLWAKILSSPEWNESRLVWHPLILHFVDVAVVGEAVLEREPAQTRQALAAALGMDWDEAKPWLLLLIACHDLGKACPAFQGRCAHLLPDLANDGLDARGRGDASVRHGAIGQVAVAHLLSLKEFGGWKQKLARQVADAVGCHHGVRFSEYELSGFFESHPAMGGPEWTSARRHLFACLHRLFGLEGKTGPDRKKRITGPDFILLAGWVSFSDWIASDEMRFPYGSMDNLADLEQWRDARLETARRALDDLGWHWRTAPISGGVEFCEVFPDCRQPRPLQRTMAEQAAALTEPSVLLIEAPMGEGKTEAAWHTHLLLREKFGHRGLYLALPSRATGNAMFSRMLEFLQSPAMRREGRREVDLQLLHGSAILNPEYQNLRLGGIHTPEGDGSVTAGEWFTHKKRALLSEYGVGTIDQALLAVLPTRHNFVRMWGLANRVVVLDEIHAYDVYTTDLILALVKWLVDLKSSVILLSATVHPSFRRQLAESLGMQPPAGDEAAYPRLTVFTSGAITPTQIHFSSSPEGRRRICLERLETGIEAIADRLAKFPAGAALALVNTVDRAQSLYRTFPDAELLFEGKGIVGKRLADGSEIYLFHSRFPAGERQLREQRLLRIFGKGAERSGRRILIATQVAEQSLDLDFDFMISDLAPVDLLLQRAGRLWRHWRDDRPAREAILAVAGLAGDVPPDFGEPLWWGAIYRQDLLLLTWLQWRRLDAVMLPDDIDALVADVYEKRIDVPPGLLERYQKAEEEALGKALAHSSLAAISAIASPKQFIDRRGDGIAWDDDDLRFALSNRNSSTRLGDVSATAIPLSSGAENDACGSLSPERARELYLQSFPVTRKKIIMRLLEIGTPAGWKRSPLLRNAYPMVMDGSGRWREDPSVVLHPELGLCYEEAFCEQGI